MMPVDDLLLAGWLLTSWRQWHTGTLWLATARLTRH